MYLGDTFELPSLLCLRAFDCQCLYLGISGDHQRRPIDNSQSSEAMPELGKKAPKKKVEEMSSKQVTK